MELVISIVALAAAFKAHQTANAALRQVEKSTEPTQTENKEEV